MPLPFIRRAGTGAKDSVDLFLCLADRVALSVVVGASDARTRFKKRLDEARELKRMLKRGEGDKDIQPGGDIDEGEDKAVPQAPRPVHTGLPLRA